VALFYAVIFPWLKIDTTADLAVLCFFVSSTILLLVGFLFDNDLHRLVISLAFRSWYACGTLAFAVLLAVDGYRWCSVLVAVMGGMSAELAVKSARTLLSAMGLLMDCIALNEESKKAGTDVAAGMQEVRSNLQLMLDKIERLKRGRGKCDDN
jgi:hypothetical protein